MNFLSLIHSFLVVLCPCRFMIIFSALEVYTTWACVWTADIMINSIYVGISFIT